MDPALEALSLTPSPEPESTLAGNLPSKYVQGLLTSPPLLASSHTWQRGRQLLVMLDSPRRN